MHCFIVFPIFLQYLTNAEYVVSSWPVASLTHRPPLPPGIFLVIIFTRGSVRRKYVTENSVTPPGIDPGTVRLVAQRLNHYATPAPWLWCVYSYGIKCDSYAVRICVLLYPYIIVTMSTYIACFITNRVQRYGVVLVPQLNEAPRCVMVQWLGVCFRSDRSVGDGRVIFGSVSIITWNIAPKPLQTRKYRSVVK